MASKKKSNPKTLTAVKKLYQSEQKAAYDKWHKDKGRLKTNSGKLKTANGKLKKMKPGKAKTAYAKKIANGIAKTVSSQKKKVKSEKTAYDKAKSNTKRYQKSREASKIFKDRAFVAMKKSDYWGIRGYIMPVYPWAATSYVFVWLDDEAPAFSTTITTNSTEKGKTVAGSSQAAATTVSITGKLGGDGGKSKMAGLKTQAQRLERWSKNATDLEWHGENTIKHVTITEFTPDFSHDVGTGGTNAISITMTLTEAEYADSNAKPKKKTTTDTGKKKKTTAKKKTKKKTTHRYIVAKAGYTYWYVHQKTGVKLATIEKLNKWPARRIPIGSHIKY